MPVTMVCESQSDISSAIRNSLSNGLNTNGNHNGMHASAASSSSATDTSLQNQFVASAKRALLNRIEYEEVNDFNNTVHDTLKSKYIVLKPSASSSQSSTTTTTTTMMTTTSVAATSTATSTSTITSHNTNNNHAKSMVNGVATDKANGTGKTISLRLSTLPIHITKKKKNQRQRRQQQQIDNQKNVLLHSFISLSSATCAQHVFSIVRNAIRPFRH